MARHVDRHDAGEVESDDPWLLVVNQTVVDPDRAPDGATFKILTIAPYELADGRSWSEAKDAYGERLVSLVAARCVGLGPDDILSMRTESPVDVAGHNPHNLGGSCHGGEFLIDGRVVSGWMRYDTDVPGLFVTGATTHPGGSVSGRPGRNAARTVLRSSRRRPAGGDGGDLSRGGSAREQHELAAHDRLRPHGALRPRRTTEPTRRWRGSSDSAGARASRLAGRPAPRARFYSDARIYDLIAPTLSRSALLQENFQALLRRAGHLFERTCVKQLTGNE